MVRDQLEQINGVIKCVNKTEFQLCIYRNTIHLISVCG